jgi:hypothetical protein
LGFNAPKKINNSILEKNWPKNDLYANDDLYEALIFVYNKEMDLLMEVNKISNEVEEEHFETCLDGGMTKKKTWC